MNQARNRLSCVITTIQRPTESVRRLALRLVAINAPLIVVGDKKGPPDYDLVGAQFLSLAEQLASDFELAGRLPIAHYARKNLGYLKAISQGASCIYETDDDNAPLDGWEPRAETVEAIPLGARDWVNVYRMFSTERIWPRGFPLDAVSDSFSNLPNPADEPVPVQAPIQQGLVNNSPDVDAIWRLALDQQFDFQSGPSVLLPRGVWCPFNSQSTWWFPVAYPLMYLPSHCSFRMTDIWRSFIAQRCLWELDLGIVFHAAEVVQERNEHDLMRDFKDEMPGYLGNKAMVSVLASLRLVKGESNTGRNLLACYEALIEAQFFPEQELDLVHAWLSDLNRMNSN